MSRVESRNSSPTAHLEQLEKFVLLSPRAHELAPRGRSDILESTLQWAVLDEYTFRASQVNIPPTAYLIPINDIPPNVAGITPLQVSQNPPI